MVVRSGPEFQRGDAALPRSGVLASATCRPDNRGNVVKKGVVALVLLLALVVIVSPGIVGRLAERSMDENLDWAAAESDDISVTSLGFDRGWFSSAGAHRVELREGPLRTLALGLAGAGGDQGLPVLIIDTRLDHGLIPLTSLSREHGSLSPGLGSAVSTLRVEFADGRVQALPGTIYSKVALNGALRSNFLLPAGNVTEDGVSIEWGDIDILLTANPGDGSILVDGGVAGVTASADAGDSTRFARLQFRGRQVPGPFGFPLGDAQLTIDSLATAAAAGTTTVEQVGVESSLVAHGDTVSGSGRLDVRGLATAYGTGNLHVDGRIANVDGPAMGRLWRYARESSRTARGGEDDTQLLVAEVVAGGMELHVDSLALELPQGPIRAELHAVLGATDPASFGWAGLLLALDANLSVSMAEPLAELAVALAPQAGAAIALGYLRREGDAYSLQAELSNGRLLLNGAPMQLPLEALQ